MNNLAEVIFCIEKILIPHTECIAWEDFSDRGNPCYNPYDFKNKQEEMEAAFTEMLVALAMPKYSYNHIALSQRVAYLLGNKWVSYDWLKKAVGRVLFGTNYRELAQMTALSCVIREKMRKKGFNSDYFDLRTLLTRNNKKHLSHDRCFYYVDF